MNTLTRILLALAFGGILAAFSLLSPARAQLAREIAPTPVKNASQKKGGPKIGLSVPYVTVAMLPGSNRALLVQGGTAPAFFALDITTSELSLLVRFGPKDVPQNMRCAALSPDGNKVLCGGPEGTIALVDLAAPKVILRFEGHKTGIVWAIAWSKDGKSFLSSCDDGTLKLWDVQTGKVIHSMGPVLLPLAVAISPDGKWGLCTTYPGAKNNGKGQQIVHVWDLATGKLAHELTGHTGLTAVNFSPDGKLALSADYNGVIRLWSVPQWKETKKLEQVGKAQHIGNAVFSMDGKTVVSYTPSEVLLWDIAAGKPPKVIDGNGEGIHAISLMADGKRFVTLSSDAVVLWDLTNAENVRTVLGGKVVGPPITCLTFLPNGKQLLSSSTAGAVLWDLTTWKPIRMMPPLGFTSSSISADSKFLISPSPLALWNLSTGKKVWEQKEYCLGCALSGDGRWAITNIEGKLRLINAETGVFIRLFDSLHEDLSYVALAISPDKKLALSKTTDGKIRAWDVATGKVVKQFDDPGPGSCHLSFSADSKLASSKHFTAKTWDVATGKLVQAAFENAAQNDNYGWAYSDDGKHCVRSGRKADKLEIWSVSTGKMILQLGPGKSGPKAFIQASFSPSGRLVAAGSVGQLIRIWEVSTGGVVKDLVQPIAESAMKVPK